MKPIGLASDHAGFELKSFVCRYLDEKGIPYVDFGTHSLDSCDYPDFGHALGRAIDSGECERGIAVCGSGEGIAMTLNKHAAVLLCAGFPKSPVWRVNTTMPMSW